MNLKGKRVRITFHQRGGSTSMIWHVLQVAFMQPSAQSGGGTFVMLCMDLDGNVNQFSVGEVGIKVVAEATGPATREVMTTTLKDLAMSDAIRAGLESGAQTFREANANIARAFNGPQASSGCPLQDDNCKAYNCPTHGIQPAQNTTNRPPITWSDHRIAMRDRVVEESDAVGTPSPDLSGALAHVAAERDTALERVAELERMRDAIQADANRLLEEKRQAVAQYERIAAEADRKLGELRRHIAKLTAVPTFMPSLTEGTEEIDGKLCWKGEQMDYGQRAEPREVEIEDGAAYKEWATRLVAERNEARRCCLELQTRIDAFTSTSAGHIVGVAANGDRLTS